MVTKEQALKYTTFQLIKGKGEPYPSTRIWVACGKCQVSETDPLVFRLPVRQGKYTVDYLTQDNCHLMEVVEAGGE